MQKYRNYLRFSSSFLLLLLLVACAGHFQSGPKLSEQITHQNIGIDSTIKADPELEAMIAPLRAEMSGKMDAIVGHAAAEMRRGKPEGALNNFVADLMVKRADAEFDSTVTLALTNVGGLRVNISAGPITLGKIYEVMPFENELVVVKMSGEQVKTLAQQIGDLEGECISGMTLVFKDKILQDIKINGAPVDPLKNYFIATTDYLSAPDRKRMSVLGECPRYFLGITLRDAILDEVTALHAAGKTAGAKIDNRIVFK